MKTVTDAGLERAVDELPDGGGPREGWQDRVLARAEVPPARRRARWPFIAGGSGLIAAAAAVALFVALRTPDRQPAKEPSVEPTVEQLEHTSDRIEVQVDRTYARLLAARTEVERLELEQALDETLRQLEAVKRELDRARVRWPRFDGGKISVKCDPSDPLCGLD